LRDLPLYVNNSCHATVAGKIIVTARCPKMALILIMSNLW